MIVLSTSHDNDILVVVTPQSQRPKLHELPILSPSLACSFGVDDDQRIRQR